MSADRPSVLVEVRKYDGTLSGRWTAARLGEDEYGVWLGTPEGARVASDGGDWTNRCAYVMAVPRGQWWIASFCTEPGPEMYCDVCTVPEWSDAGTVLRTVDLDLDVVRSPGGTAYSKDEDEFAEHRVRFGYPDLVVTEAERTCAWLMEAGRRDSEGAEPFASVYRHWLARFVTGSG
ncbi:DUF402 domain-containing protein [Actinacidiphila acidipaludis]|uniref:DUF402 domain-containing protein n=1 Tax=Actinacidiphila acidipaludis TaxID=2873382 RepID=A0ABS7PZZ3_9ACTN|nr:DUF402 domain-containing protein [Streptomyces acidipaludis]MBY8876064.1 DUF402 domain-containing protein [Streptomyces acidipaludis]